MYFPVNWSHRAKAEGNSLTVFSLDMDIVLQAVGINLTYPTKMCLSTNAIISSLYGGANIKRHSRLLIH